MGRSHKACCEAFYGTKPNLRGLPEFGSKVWVHTPEGSKLDGRSVIGRWVGFDEESSGHRIYSPEKRTVSRHVPLEGEKVKEKVEQSIVPPSSSEGRSRERGQLPKGIQEGDTAKFVDCIEPDLCSVIAAVAVMDVEGDDLEPSYDEARQRSDWPKWKEAIDVELGNLKAAGTWEVVERPHGTNVVDSKWVFRLKKDVKSTVWITSKPSRQLQDFRRFDPSLRLLLVMTGKLKCLISIPLTSMVSWMMGKRFTWSNRHITKLLIVPVML